MVLFAAMNNIINNVSNMNFLLLRKRQYVLLDVSLARFQLIAFNQFILFTITDGQQKLVNCLISTAMTIVLFMEGKGGRLYSH